MEKDNVFTYEPKMKANLELIMDIMRCDCQEIVYKDKQVADLEAKLAEKDELIGTLKNKYECTDRELYLTKDTLKHYTNIYNSLVESRHQDKISFCIEKLEQVKNIIDSKVKNINKRLDDLNIKIVCESTSRELDTYEEIVKEIDKKIEELKKGL